MNEETRDLNCKKIVCELHMGRESTLLGLITDMSGDFVKFKTAKRDYMIPKNKIISISGTDELFKEMEDEST